MRDWAGRKLEALRCYRSQCGPESPFWWIDESDAREWLGVEQFRRIGMGAAEGLLEPFGESVE
ncbi:hypothetical protein D3C83_280520 [compost metagenome]